MKKIITILVLVLFNKILFGQTNVIGTPRIIGNLEIAQRDFQLAMSWEDAKNACHGLGKGWRLPTKEELNTMYKFKEKIGGFSNELYWSVTEKGTDLIWVQGFKFGNQFGSLKNIEPFYVRAVRSKV